MVVRTWETVGHRPRRPVATATVLLYLLVNALLTLCLVHPEEGASHGQHHGHLDVVCLWVQKAVSFHAPSAPPSLAVAHATLFLLLAPATTITRGRVIRLTGRSPPLA